MSYFNSCAGVVGMGKYNHMPLSYEHYASYSKTEKVFVEMYESFSNVIRDHIYHGVYNLKMTDNDFVPAVVIDNAVSGSSFSIDVNATSSIVNSIRKCRKRKLVQYHNPLTIRGYSPDGHSVTILLSSDNDEVKCTKYHLALIVSEPTHLDSICYAFNVDLNGYGLCNTIHYLVNTCIIHCDEKEYMDDRFASIYDNTVRDNISGHTLYLVEKVLRSCVDQFDMYGDSKIEFPVYTKAELKLFNDELTVQNITQLTHPLLTTVRKGLTPDDIMDSNDKFEDLVKYPEDTFTWPIVKLSQKEWKFIDKWIDDNMDHDAPLNLVTYMDSPRYGRNIKFPYKAANGKEVTFEVMYQLSEESLRLVCHEIINDSCRIVNYFDIEDPMHFKDITSNMLACIRYITTRSLNDSPIGNDALYSASVSLNMSFDDLCGILTSIIKVFIIIHHRPERTRVINYSERRTVYGNKNNKKSAYQKDVTVWRMLAPIKEAKEYVTRMSTGARRDAVYTLEEWERRGHYRTLKSGKVIWINETHCKRKLPISDREIHIKL